MYQAYFGLAEAPFSIAPDPRYLYLSQRHQEALAHLLYGVNSGGGFVLLTGEIGAGKTTVCRCLLEQMPQTCDVAYIFNPQLTVGELLSTICVEFGIEIPPNTTSVKVFVDRINAFLLDAHARGRQSVLIIDEAQNLSTVVLEQMRLLTNLETNQRKLLQIILLGQPELAVMLERPELRQLAQRVVARYHLGPLTKGEIGAYVKHRLEIAGTQRNLFPPALMGRLYLLSGGIPRVINVLCDRALLGTYVQGRDQVNRATVSQAAREVLYQGATARRSLVRPLLLILVLTVVAALAFIWQSTFNASQPLNVTTPAPSAALPAKPAPASKPVKVVAPLAAVLDWPEDAPRQNHRELAYAALFKAWGADYENGDPCLQAEDRGLRCQKARGGLNELRQFNRPAVLAMRDAQGQEFSATLVHLDNASATFRIAAHEVSVAVGALAAQWSGHYTILWRPRPDTPKPLRKGDHGPAAEWVEQQLTQLSGGAVKTTGSAEFDDAMERRVKEFQLAEGLVPDGVLGSRTLQRLGSAADPTAPRLLGAKRGE